MSILRKKSIEIPIYYGNFHIILCDSLEDVWSRYDLTGDPSGWEAVAFWKTRKTGYKDYFVAFTPSCTLKTVVHECVHIVNKVFRDRGIELDVNNDEPQAYFTGWVFDQAYKFLNKTINENKRDRESIAF